ncbi:MAG: tetratricopeptide repeat protein [Burkholderiales bacterium]
MQEQSISRNAPCPCGSGKKYKHCCGSEDGFRAVAERGIAECRKGNFSQGVAWFKRALEKQPDSAECWLNLGNAYKELSNSAQAIHCYRRVISLKPNVAVARYNLAVALEATGQTEEAIASYHAALSIEPGYVQASYNLAAALQGEDRLEEAIAWYEKTLTLEPRHANASFNLGVANAKLGRNDEAIECYLRTLRHQPDAFDALTNLADLYAGLGRDDEARDYYQRALQSHPSLARVHLGLGRLHGKRNELDCALDCFSRALQCDPDCIEAHQNQGTTLFELGRLNEAVAPLRRALELTRKTGAHEINPSPNFAKTSRSKLRHDLEQFDYLIEKRSIAEGYSAVADQYRALLDRLDFDQTHLVDLPDDALPGLAPVYNRLVNFYDAPRVSCAINPALNARAIADAYRANAPGIAHVDELLTPEALRELRRFCHESTIWYNFKYPNGYLGASVDDGFYCPLLAQIAEELPRALPEIFKQHRLTHLWAFKYDSRMRGIDVHADFAAVNVNFWITADSANFDPKSGGLVLWDKEAPADWDFAVYNNDVERIHEFLRASSAKATTIPYRENRAVIFNSDLFHKTDDIDFADGYENRRINVTLLYGVREKA